MKKMIPALLVLMAVILAGCSGVPQSDYQKSLDEKAQLESEVDSLKIEIDNLQTQLNTSKSSDSGLKSSLTATYDAYRYMMLYVTTEVYGNTLTKSEWETYITKNEYPAPTYDEVNKLLAK